MGETRASTLVAIFRALNDACRDAEQYVKPFISAARARNDIYPGGRIKLREIKRIGGRLRTSDEAPTIRVRARAPAIDAAGDASSHPLSFTRLCAPT